MVVDIFWVVAVGATIYNNPIGTNKTEKNKVKKRQIQKLKPGKCSLCLTNLRSLCCKEVQETIIFKNQQTKKHMILHNVNYASSSIIYLMERILCNKQYVGKKETSFTGNAQVLFSSNPQKSGALRHCITFPQIT